MTYSFHPDAEDEFNQAIDYYENCNRGLLTILFILTLLSCSNNTNRIEKDPIITEVFDIEEIKELRTALNLFDDSLKQLMQKDNTLEAYYTFTDSLKYWQTEEEYYLTMQLLKPTVFNAIDLLENGKLFSQSLYINYGFRPQSKKQDTLSYFWEPIYDGKYFDFLDKLSERDNRFEWYKEGIESSGSIPPSCFQTFSLLSRELDLEKESNRIAFIFHYIILLSEKEYK